MKARAMPEEIERKFLLADDQWKRFADEGQSIRQIYLTCNDAIVVRVRIVDERTACLTLKTAARGYTRKEFEYEIPLDHARDLMKIGPSLPIEKTRYRIPAGKGLTWEIDQFAGRNTGLVVAEIELSHENQEFERPKWLGREVSDEPRYFNVNLAAHPYCDWN